MNSNAEQSKDFLDALGERLFSVIDQALPSMGWTMTNSGRWTSKVHTDGEASKSEASTIYENTPLWIQDFARGAKSVIWAVVDIEHKAETYTDAVAYLCSFAGIDAPRLSEAQQARIISARRLNEAQKAYKDALTQTDTSKEAQAVRDYLIKRGWSLPDILCSGLGYISETSRALLYTEEEAAKIAADITHPMHYVGKYYTLAIPVWTGGNVSTFKFRNIFATEKKDRYRGLADQQRTSLGCLPLRGQADTVIVVEGELDALHDLAIWRQIGENEKRPNHIPVVSTGMGAVTPKMAENAIRRGATYFILAFDQDEHKERHTSTSAHNIHAAGGVALVIDYPEGYKDLDEMYCDMVETEDGKKRPRFSVYDTQQMAEHAKPYAYWIAQKIIAEGETSDGLNSYKNRRTISKAIAETPAEERPLVIRAIDGLNCPDLDAQALTHETTKETQDKAHAATLRRAADLMAKGDKIGADKVLKRLDKYEAQNKDAEFAHIFETLDPDQLMAYLSTIPEGIPTGIKFKQHTQEEDLTLNAGLTFICGSRGHGKTSFLNNIALNEARRNIRLKTGKNVLYFSYEIDKRRLIADLLGTFVNDPDLNRSKSPQDAIISYFKGVNRWISTQPVNGYGSPSHLQNFEAKKDEFFRDFISSGAIAIVDEAYKVEKLLDAIRYYTAMYTPSIVCIDYAQLIYSEDYSRLRTEEIKKVLNDIKDLANKQGIPVVLAAQFNREVDSPISVDTKNIGEGGDVERIADTCLGIYNLKELHPLTGPNGHDEEKAAKELLQSLGVATYGNGDKLKPIHGKIFVRLLKRRYGFYPLDTVLNWEGKTKHITLNDGNALYGELQGEQQMLFASEEDAPF